MPYKRKQDYNEYMRKYMRDLRIEERRLIRLAREMGLGSTKIRRKKEK